MKKVLVIGAGFLQDFVIQKAKKMGYEVHAVDADPNAVGFKHADHYGVVNIVDEKACLEYAKENQINGVLTAATDYGVLTAAYIAQEMGLPGLKYEVAQLIKNKYKVRKCLYEHHVDDTEQAYEVHEDTNIEELAQKLTYPVMVKPCDGSGSRGASRVDRKEELKERNEWLQYEYEREKEHQIVEEQNRLYDLLQSKTQRQLDKIEQLTLQYKKTDALEDKQRILSHIVVLGSFIKRRKDFILSIDSTPTIPEKKLSSALGESFRALKKMNINGGFFVNTEKEFIDGQLLTLAYDFFEDVIELVLDIAKYVNVSVCVINGVLRINIMVDCNCATDYLRSKYPQVSIFVEDDGTEFVMPLEGGAR